MAKEKFWQSGRLRRQAAGSIPARRTREFTAGQVGKVTGSIPATPTRFNMKNNKELPNPIREDSESFRGSEFLKRCRVEVYDPKQVSWEEIGGDILGVELSASGAEGALDEETLRKGFEDPESVIVLMRDSVTNKIVGFTYAKPAVKTYQEDFPERQATEDTAYIYDTEIQEQYQGRGLVSVLIAKLEQELLVRGFSFIERDADNNRDSGKPDAETYADKIRKNYRGRIIKEEPHDSEYGQQVYFRIRLNKSKK